MQTENAVEGHRIDIQVSHSRDFIWLQLDEPSAQKGIDLSEG